MHIHPSERKAFTLIELLVVIAIIAILTVVAILTLNPAELLKQARDSNRLSDLATLSSALGAYSEDLGGNSGFFMGAPATLYFSTPDASATSTAGNQCQGFGILTSTYAYQCSAASTTRNVNGTGWIPVNLSSISAGAPIGALPIDATNLVSSSLYYTYATDGTKFAVTAALESQKYLKQYLLTTVTDPLRMGGGNNLALVSAQAALTGYWNFNEGQGSSVPDQSSNGNTGVWNGASVGTNGHYSAGKVGNWAGAFDGVTNYVPTNLLLPAAPPVSIAAWMNTATTSAGIIVGAPQGINSFFFDTVNTGNLSARICDVAACNSDLVTSGVNIQLNTWYFVVFTFTGSTRKIYVNGNLSATDAAGRWVQPASTTIGSRSNTSVSIGFDGLIDDVRIYNRVLSATDIQAMYNAEK